VESIKCQEYSIFFNDWDSLNGFISEGNYSSLMLIVDENSRKHCMPDLLQNLNHDFLIIEIASSEKNKSLETSKSIWQKMVEHRADRNSLCVNLGGGVIGDMGGFCASSFMRGIDFIQMPTTLLSMVDSSIGGKLGIDFNGLKNLVGFFKDPKGVFIFSNFLKSLPHRELMSGMAEVYKYGLIKDLDFWNAAIAPNTLSADLLDSFISRSIQIKKEITDQDPLEKGLRKILNFGHTIGHAIETANLEKEGHLLHGEAVALGMIAESYIANAKRMLSEQELKMITDSLLSKYDFPEHIILETEIIYGFCLNDKKNRNHRILASLITKIGKSEYNVEINKQEIEDALFYLNNKLK